MDDKFSQDSIAVAWRFNWKTWMHEISLPWFYILLNSLLLSKLTLFHRINFCLVILAPLTWTCVLTHCICNVTCLIVIPRRQELGYNLCNAIESFSQNEWKVKSPICMIKIHVIFSLSLWVANIQVPMLVDLPWGSFSRIAWTSLVALECREQNHLNSRAKQSRFLSICL